MLLLRCTLHQHQFALMIWKDSDWAIEAWSGHRWILPETPNSASFQRGNKVRWRVSITHRVVSFDSSECSRADVQLSSAETRRCRQDRHSSHTSWRLYEQGYILHTASAGMFKASFFFSFFLQAFASRRLLFCEVKLKLMTDMTP